MIVYDSVKLIHLLDAPIFSYDTVMKDAAYLDTVDEMCRTYVSRTKVNLCKPEMITF